MGDFWALTLIDRIAIGPPTHAAAPPACANRLVMPDPIVPPAESTGRRRQNDGRASGSVSSTAPDGTPADEPRRDPGLRRPGEASEDAIIGQTLGGTILSWNSGAESLYGYGAAELVGRSISFLTFPHWAGELQQLLDLVRQGRTLPHVEAVHLRKDGAPVPVTLTLSPIRDAGGEVVGASMVARAAEQLPAGGAASADWAEVQKPLTELRYVTSHARCLLWHGTVMDTGGGPGSYEWKTRVFDEAAAQAFMPLDVLPQESYTSAWYRHRLPQDQRHTNELSAEALHENRPSYSAEFGCRGRDGQVRWFDERVYVEPLTPPAGTHGYWRVVGVAIDVTERRRAGAELRASEERFRQLAENIQEVFWMIEPGSSRTVYISPAYEEIWGRSCESLYQDWRSFLDAVHPEDRERVAESVRQQIAGEPTVQEYRVVRPDGSLRWVLDRAFPIQDESGAVYRVAGIAADITHLKAVEAELREANQAKDEFLTMLAHELRNPLGAIRNALEVMDRTRPEEPAHRRAREVAKRQVQLQTRMVSDLLDVSRIARHSLRLQRERVDFAQLCREVVEDFRPALHAAGLTLSLELPETTVPVLGDSTRLTQVVANLLDNAIKFSESGGRVTVRVASDRPGTHEVGGGRVTLEVRDTGIGIEPDLLPMVFEIFTQAEQTLARSRGGLGLGLALVKGLVEQHGGEVAASSEGPGSGAAFVLWLPVTAEPLTEERPHPEAVSMPAARRVLIIEDIQDAAETLRDLLQLLDCQVEIARSGRSGVERARAVRPDVVLCDIGLPGMDGYEVAAALRRDPLTEDVRLIAVSGYGREEDQRRSREAGFDQHLVKPVDVAELQRLLEVMPRQQER
jgi:PAS domain S-box-containing protein